MLTARLFKQNDATPEIATQETSDGLVVTFNREPDILKVVTSFIK